MGAIFFAEGVAAGVSGESIKYDDSRLSPKASRPKVKVTLAQEMQYQDWLTLFQWGNESMDAQCTLWFGINPVGSRKCVLRIQNCQKERKEFHTTLRKLSVWLKNPGERLPNSALSAIVSPYDELASIFVYNDVTNESIKCIPLPEVLMYLNAKSELPLELSTDPETNKLHRRRWIRDTDKTLSLAAQLL